MVPVFKSQQQYEQVSKMMLNKKLNQLHKTSLEPAMRNFPNGPLLLLHQNNYKHPPPRVHSRKKLRKVERKNLERTRKKLTVHLMVEEEEDSGGA